MSELFGIDLYPTPASVARKMIAPFMDEGSFSVFPLKKFTVLEPSAGTGSILDALKEASGCDRHSGSEFYSRVSCLEIDPALQAVLRESGYHVVAGDFLNWQPQKMFNLILMNPPFSSGADHLLHAWDILHNGDIACLLNAETILNPCTEKRQALKRIIEDNKGSVEYLGDCFKNAARKTDVNVALVRLSKKDNSQFNFKFRNSGGEKSFSLDTENEVSELACRDIVGNLVIEFDRSREVFVKALEVLSELRQHTSVLNMSGTSLQECLKYYVDNYTEQEPESAYNNFSDVLRKCAWDKVFRETKFNAVMSRKVKNKFNDFQQQQGKMDFSKENIYNLLNTLLDSRMNIFNEVIAEVFDEFTKYHEENRVHVEGWKTNDAFKVNRRVILPSVVEKGFDGFYRVHWRETFCVDDIDRAICFIAGKKLENIKTIEKTVKAMRINGGELGHSEFFDIRCYMKGTMHLFFREEWIWRRFNLVACDGKNWLPGDVKKREEAEIERLMIA